MSQAVMSQEASETAKQDVLKFIEETKGIENIGDLVSTYLFNIFKYDDYAQILVPFLWKYFPAKNLIKSMPNDYSRIDITIGAFIDEYLEKQPVPKGLDKKEVIQFQKSAILEAYKDFWDKFSPQGYVFKSKLNIGGNVDDVEWNKLQKASYKFSTPWCENVSSNNLEPSTNSQTIDEPGTIKFEHIQRPLVAIIGIGAYDKTVKEYAPLDGVAKDYEHSIATFTKYLNYHTVYQINVPSSGVDLNTELDDSKSSSGQEDNADIENDDPDPKLLVNGDKSTVDKMVFLTQNRIKNGWFNNNFKLHWKKSEIFKFLENISKIAKLLQSDGLILIMACHGSTDLLVDSLGE